MVTLTPARYICLAFVLPVYFSTALPPQHPLPASGAKEQEPVYLPLVVWHGLGDKYGLTFDLRGLYTDFS